jgi:hypothetical protein
MVVGRWTVCSDVEKEVIKAVLIDSPAFTSGDLLLD